MLEWFEPHYKCSAHLAKSVDVTGDVVLSFVTDKGDNCFCEVVAISSEGIIVTSMPEVSNVVDDFIDLIKSVVGSSYRNRLFQVKQAD